MPDGTTFESDWSLALDSTDEKCKEVFLVNLRHGEHLGFWGRSFDEDGKGSNRFFLQSQ